MFKHLVEKAKDGRGFTLVELMVVVTIISILVSIAVPSYVSVVADAEKNVCQANKRIIFNAIHYFQFEHPGEDPADLDGYLAAGSELEEYFDILPMCPKAETDDYYRIKYHAGSDTFVVECTADASHNN